MSKGKEESLGTITRNRAIKIFEALGFKTASKWDTARLQKKLIKLDVLVGGTELDSKTQKRVDEILRAQKKERIVTVVDVEKVETNKQLEQDVKDAKRRETDRKAEKKKQASKKEKKMSKKKTEKTKASQKKTEKMKRSVAVAKVVKQNKSIDVDALCKKADTLLKASGTGSNIRETTYQAKIVLEALEEVGYVLVEGGIVNRV